MSGPRKEVDQRVVLELQQ
uniref:Uncharacterized protein n=1 Tax=Arundo donax TaxID=35708 RepID=A0A0A9D052_ARUDO